MLRSNRNTLIVLVLMSLGLIVLFFILPQQPASVREKMEKPMDADSLQLAQAVELVNGENPMQGIKMLQGLLQKDSTNIEAHYWLGVFSVRSGQMDKAIRRFETVLDLDPLYMPACIDLGGLYMEMDSLQLAKTWFNRAKDIDSTNNYALLFSAQTEEKMGLLKEAKGNYEQLLRHNSDTIVEKRVKEFIQNIDKKLIP